MSSVSRGSRRRSEWSRNLSATNDRQDGSLSRLHDPSLLVRFGGSLTDRATDIACHVPKLRGTVRRCRSLRSRLIDRALSVDTVAIVDTMTRVASHGGDALWYEPTDYLLLRRFARRLQLTPSDVVVDIGCGKARPLALLGRRKVRRCIGIELDPRLATVAQENANRLRGRRTAIEIVQGDAMFADFGEATVIWFYNSFGPDTLRSVLDALGESLRTHPRKLQIVYVNPVHEWLLYATPWLRRTGQDTSPFFKTYGASYWQSSQELTVVSESAAWTSSSGASRPS